MIIYEYINREPIIPHTSVVKVSWWLPDYRSLLKRESKEIWTTKDETRKWIGKFLFDDEHKFQLKLQISGRNNQLIKFYYLAPKPVVVKCDLILVNRKCEKYKVTCQDYQPIEANKWHFLWQCSDAEDFMSHCASVDYNFYVRSEKHYEMVLRITPDVSPLPPMNSERFDPEYETHRDKVANIKLIRDLSNLLKDHMFSDITIKSNDGVEIRAHKGILAGRSPVFRAHFDHDMVESLTNVVEAPFENEVLQVVLKYIYEADTVKLNDIPEEVLIAADFYQLDELKKLCEDILCEQLTVQNVIKLLQLSNMYSALNLERACLKYINLNKKLVIQSDGWKEMESIELCKRIAEFKISNY